MARVRTPRIKEFPSDGRCWRVDWFGALLQNPQITTEPVFEVVISPVLDSGDVPLSSMRATDLTQQQVILIGVGQLPFIEIGSIWKNGCHQDQHAGTSQVFNGIEIGPRTVQEISSLHKLDNRNIIPYKHYRISKAGVGSSIVAIKHNNDPYGILIPAMELIRFYYAVSSNMAHAVFSGAFQTNRDLILNTQKSHYIPDEDRVVLCLPQYVVDEDAWVIARILRSPVAAESCRKIFDCIIQNRVNQNLVHLSSSFPFEGESTLRTRVKSIPGQKEGQWRYLVLSICACSAPMPYQNLTVVRANDGRKANPETDLPYYEKKPYPKRAAGNEKDSERLALQSEREANASLVGVNLQMASERFSALLGRQPDKPTKTQCEYVSAGLSTADFAVETLGTGLGSHEQDNQAVQKANINMGVTRKRAAAPCFDLFADAIVLLNNAAGVDAKLRQVGERLQYMPLIKPEGYWQWSYLDSSTRLPREVMIADISLNGRFFNLIEFQQRATERCTLCLVISHEYRLTDTQLYDLLWMCAVQHGVWKNIEFEAGDLISLKHTWTGFDSLSRTVLTRLDHHPPPKPEII